MSRLNLIFGVEVLPVVVTRVQWNLVSTYYHWSIGAWAHKQMLVSKISPGLGSSLQFSNLIYIIIYSLIDSFTQGIHYYILNQFKIWYLFSLQHQLSYLFENC